MPKRCHQELWLPSGHYVAEYDYWPADPGDRSHNPPMGGEVEVTAVTDLTTGVRITEGQNPKLFFHCAREIENRLDETAEDRFF